MAHTDPRVDAYIERAAPFARPILARLRAAVHAGCPTAEETIKWGMPFFMHGGKLLANIAAFKQHCAFGFWNGRGAERTGSEGMGRFGKLKALADLPPQRELARIVAQAAAEIDAGVTRAPRAPKGADTKAPPDVPPTLAAALAANPAARDAFAAFSPSKRRDYIDWVAEAKREATRDKRVAQAIEWIAEGKGRNWKYER